MPNKKLIVIGGATASGKTEAAIAVARHLNTEIVGADARQIYTEMAVGVGRPAADQLAAVPHHLIGHVSIHQPYSAGQYLRDALNVLDKIFARHDVAVLVGGTGLYIQAILEGMDDIPAAPEELVKTWRRIAEEEGITRLQAETERLDPAYFAVVDRHNPARLLRAITVSLHTGKPYSSFRTGQKQVRDFEPIRLLADLPRKSLYDRIDQRVLTMLAEGWLDEARSLYPFRHLSALQTVGYPELFAHLDGLADLPVTIDRIRQSTRRYAKRQTTWFRHHGPWHTVDASQPGNFIQAVANHVTRQRPEIPLPHTRPPGSDHR